MSKPRVKLINKVEPEEKVNTSVFTSCFIVDSKGNLILQKRGDNWPRYPGFISMFGGEVNLGETPREGLVRELKEELGVNVSSEHLRFLGLVTEASSNYEEQVYEYFWHADIEFSVCNEGEIIRFASLSDLKSSARLMDDVVWAIDECKKLDLVK